MSGSGFSRRDLLNLGGKLVLSVGAAKLVVVLPGCGGGGSDDPKIDAPKMPDAAPDAPKQLTLDACHEIGTYHYSYYYANGPYPAYTYHYYFRNSYGCPYIYPPVGIRCYPDYLDWAPGYAYFCFGSYYETTTSP